MHINHWNLVEVSGARDEKVEKRQKSYEKYITS